MPLTLRLVLIALFAYAGYQRAGWFERRYGRTPWGLPAVVWAVFTGFSLILGCLLLAVAERQGRKAAAQRPAGPAGHAGTPFGAAPGGPPPFGAPQFGAPPVAAASSGASPFGAPQFGTLQAAPAFGPPPTASAPLSGHPVYGGPPRSPAPAPAPYGAAPSPQFGAPPSGQFGAAPGEPARRRPPLNEWQDDPSGGFFGTAT